MKHYTAIYTAVSHHLGEIEAPDYDTAMDTAFNAIDTLMDEGIFDFADDVSVELVDDEDPRIYCRAGEEAWVIPNGMEVRRSGNGE